MVSRVGSSSTFKYIMTHWPTIALTLSELCRCPKLSHRAVMNDSLRTGAWDKGSAEMMYLTIEYPNYSITSLLTQPAWLHHDWEKFDSTNGDLNLNSHHPLLNVLTTKLRSPLITLNDTYCCEFEQRLSGACWCWDVVELLLLVADLFSIWCSYLEY